MHDVLNAMNSHGLNPDQFICDGNIHRFRVDNSSSKPGWYVCYSSGVCVFGNFKTGLKEIYRPSGRTDSENKIIDEQIRKAQAAAKIQRENEQLEIAKTLTHDWVNDEWDNDVSSHPYVLAKKIIAVPNVKVKFGALHIPSYQFNSDLIWSYQRIFADGKKRFASGAKADGGFFVIDGSTDIVYMCEGFATGVTIHMATGNKVICCFSADGLVKVAKHLPKDNYVIAADDDWPNGINAGHKAAMAASESLGAPVVFPKFKSLDSKPTDFNDLLCLEGIDVVKEQLMVTGEQKTTALAPLDRAGLIDILPHWNYSKPNRDGECKPTTPKATIENVAALLKYLGVIIRYNVIAKQEEIIIPNESFSLDNEANAVLAIIMSWQNQIGMPTKNTSDFITRLADMNLYNPVTEWVESKPWDGVSRLDEFYSTIKAVGESEDATILELKKTFLKRWMISAVAAAFEPRGVSAHGVLVLQGDQYIGKTAWVKSLAPKDLNVIADGKMLRPDDKDSVNQIVRYWIVELGELDATFKRADIAQLKAFITKDSDLFRRAYAKKESNFARRTVFFGSVNDAQFLNDPTGNRRFWTIECDSINYAHAMDMQQIWAEFYSLYKSGETWILNKDEVQLLNVHNEKFEVVSPFAELIATRYAWDDKKIARFKRTATQIAIEMGYEKPSKRDINEIAAIMRKVYKQKPEKTKKGRFFEVPYYKGDISNQI